MRGARECEGVTGGVRENRRGGGRAAEDPGSCIGAVDVHGAFGFQNYAGGWFSLISRAGRFHRGQDGAKL